MFNFQSKVHRIKVPVIMIVSLFLTQLNFGQKTFKIMPLGDSVTELDGSYRILLWNLLTNDSFKVDFVGSVKSPLPGLGDHDHNGYGGRTIGPDQSTWGNIYNMVPDIFSKNKPDIILLHIGTNEFFNRTAGDGVDMKTSYVRLSNLIDTLLNSVPGVKIAVASLIKFAWGTTAEWQAYNDSLYKVVLRKQAAGKHIFYVPMYQEAGMVTADYKSAGDVHPNKTGYRKMAMVWYKYLVPLLADTMNQIKAKISCINATFKVNEKVWFNGSASSGKITGYKWFINKNIVSTDSALEKSFSIPGHFKLKLEVTDINNAISSSEKEIEIVSNSGNVIKGSFSKANTNTTICNDADFETNTDINSTDGMYFKVPELQAATITSIAICPAFQKTVSCLGLRIEAAMTSDFSDAMQIATINDTLKCGILNLIPVNTNLQFRFIKITAPNGKVSAVAELQFVGATADYTSVSKNNVQDQLSEKVFYNSKLKQIEFSNNNELKGFFYIYSINGRTISQGEIHLGNNYIDSSNLYKGVYFVSIILKNKMIKSKIVIS